jgi:hypothetical protein
LMDRATSKACHNRIHRGWCGYRRGG